MPPLQGSSNVNKKSYNNAIPSGFFEFCINHNDSGLLSSPLDLDVICS